MGNDWISPHEAFWFWRAPRLGEANPSPNPSEFPAPPQSPSSSHPTTVAHELNEPGSKSRIIDLHVAPMLAGNRGSTMVPTIHPRAGFKPI
jgi:hypothetical protein